MNLEKSYMEALTTAASGFNGDHNSASAKSTTKNNKSSKTIQMQRKRNLLVLPESGHDIQSVFPLSTTFKLTRECIWQHVGEFDNLLDLRSASVMDNTRMLSSEWVSEKSVRLLWQQKNRMDDLFDDGKGCLYYRMCERICPLDRKGSKVFWNRAGDKLAEINKLVPFLPTDIFGSDPPLNSSFIDICGGPGAWSLFLFERLPGCRGFGVSSRLPGMPGDGWYPTLLNNDHFTPLWGADGTGDVCNQKNQEEIVKSVGRGSAAIAVSDGGSYKKKDKGGNHVENLQELFSGRIILSETYLALSCLMKGGSFVCKIFDTFSNFTVSFIYMMCSLFEKVNVVKPPHSRRVNSERYLVCVKRVGDEDLVRACLELMNLFLRKGFGDSEEDDFENHQSPNSILLEEYYRKDPRFNKDIKSMGNILAERQTETIYRVMNVVDLMK